MTVFDYTHVVPVVGYYGYLGSRRLHRLVGVVVGVERWDPRAVTGRGPLSGVTQNIYIFNCNW